MLVWLWSLAGLVYVRFLLASDLKASLKSCSFWSLPLIHLMWRLVWLNMSSAVSSDGIWHLASFCLLWSKCQSLSNLGCARGPGTRIDFVPALGNPLRICIVGWPVFATNVRLYLLLSVMLTYVVHLLSCYCLMVQSCCLMLHIHVYFLLK